MNRWVLLNPTCGGTAPEDLDRLAGEDEITILRRADGAALIEASEEDLPRVRRLLPGWRIGPERDLGLPE